MSSSSCSLDLRQLFQGEGLAAFFVTPINPDEPRKIGAACQSKHAELRRELIRAVESGKKVLGFLLLEK